MAFATTNHPSTETLLAQRINERLPELKMSLNDLAAKTGSTYEYVRKLSRGLALPSKYMLRVLAEAIGLKYDEMEKIVVEDRIRMKYGEASLKVRGRSLAMEPFEKMVPQLDKAQREQIIGIMETWVKNNRKKKSG